MPWYGGYSGGPLSRELLQQPVSPKRKPSSAALPSLGPTLLHSTSVLSPAVQRVMRSSMLLAARPVGLGKSAGPAGPGLGNFLVGIPTS